MSQTLSCLHWLMGVLAYIVNRFDCDVRGTNLRHKATKAAMSRP